MVEKSPEAFKTISEAAIELGVEQHVLRFWETKFTQIKPLKRQGGRRFYRPEDMALLHRVKELLYKQGFTIKGAKKALSSKTTDMAADAPESLVAPAVANAAHAMAVVATKSRKPATPENQLDLLGAPAPVATPVISGFTSQQRGMLEAVLSDLRGAQKRLQSAL